MGYTLLFDGMGERPGDVVLSHDILKALRPVLTGYDLVAHSSAESGAHGSE